MTKGEIILDTGHFAKYSNSKTKKTEKLEVDITNFHLGYGENSDIESFNNLIQLLKKEGWKNNGIEVKTDRYDAVDDVTLNLSR